MILAEVNSTPVLTNIAVAPRRFTIKASQRAFQILSGFYSDPLGAIPRELGANAWDSHVKAGNVLTPFEVHVPNTLEPWFSVRDFGVGMSVDDVNIVYTSYFESTKANSNDFDGCMGLGSKTPFNYTQNFNVTVWYDGVKSSYNCFIAEDGTPNILPLDSAPSDEPTGVLVKFSVKQDDIRTFVEKIRTAYSAFRVKPKLVGIHDIEYPEVKYSHEGKDGNWGIRDMGTTNHYRQYRNCVALMGNYRYPINVNLVGAYNDCKHVTKDELMVARQILQNSNLELMFNIGDLEVSPNKETLQYDSEDRTRSAIIKAAAAAHAELKASIMAKIDTPKTRWEAMRLYNSVNSYENNGCYLREIIGTIEIPFNGTRITRSNISIHDAIALCPGGKFTSPKFELYQLSYNSNADRFKTRSAINLDASYNNPHFFYTNSDGIKRSRIRQFLRTKFTDSKYPNIYLIVDQSSNFSDMWAIQTALGIDNTSFFNIESLPKPPRPAKATSAGPKEKITDGLLCTATDSIAAGRTPYVAFVTRTFEIDPNSTYYYVPMRFQTAYVELKTPGKKFVDTKNIDDGPLAWLLQYAVQEEIIPKDTKHILGINIKSRKVMNVGKWVNVLDLAYHKAKKSKVAQIEQQLFEIQTRNDIAEKWGNFQRLFGSYYDNDAKAFIGGLKNEKTREFFKKLRQLIINRGTVLNAMDDAFEDIFDIKPVQHKPLDLNKDEVTNIFTNKYMELFSFIDCYSQNSAKLANLINFIDENTKTP